MPDSHTVLPGANAEYLLDTLVEFEARVRTFIGELDRIADSTAVFGHGIWLGMLHWLLLGTECTTPTTCAHSGAFRLRYRCQIARCSGCPAGTATGYCQLMQPTVR